MCMHQWNGCLEKSQNWKWWWCVIIICQSEDFEALSDSQSFSGLLMRVRFGLFYLEVSYMANITYSTFNVDTTVKKMFQLKKVRVCAALKWQLGYLVRLNLKFKAGIFNMHTEHSWIIFVESKRVSWEITELDGDGDVIIVMDFSCQSCLAQSRFGRFKSGGSQQYG